MIRQPIVAGHFYPAERDECSQQLQICVGPDGDRGPPDGTAIGGIVPHAGWVFSGRIAGQVWRRLASASRPRTVVLLGGARAVLLEHTSSARVCAERGDPCAENSVGYAGFLISKPTRKAAG